VAEALPKSLYQRESVSPFGVFRGISAKEIQQELRVAPMTELHPFLSSLVRPLFPWLLSTSNVALIRDGQDSRVLAIEALCWSRALGRGVVVRFGRRDRFGQALQMVAIGSNYQDIEVTQKDLVYKTSDHFEGAVREVLSIDFSRYFEPPPAKRDSLPKP
jgi:hypothetical protein